MNFWGHPHNKPFGQKKQQMKRTRKYFLLFAPARPPRKKKLYELNTKTSPQRAYSKRSGSSPNFYTTVKTIKRDAFRCFMMETIDFEHSMGFSKFCSPKFLSTLCSLLNDHCKTPKITNFEPSLHRRESSDCSKKCTGTEN